MRGDELHVLGYLGHDGGDRRAERLDVTQYPLVVESGQHIFGDPDSRFADSIGVIVDSVGRMRL
jgi:hypothetical protein